ncbi:MAG TPA: AIPR family protein [Gemmatimonadales bacterium]|nr:AIPR family protein [Gemmatimonadales bacterium]
MGKAKQKMPLEVRHVREALLREFEPLIPMDDFEKKDPDDIRVALLSRAVAAKAARILTDCDSEEAAAGVIDGRDDFGIDAVAFSASGTELWLIQAKWKDTGTAGFNTEAALKLIHGLKKLDDREFDQFNERLRLLADRVHGVLKLPTCKVHLVVALMGDGRLSPETRNMLDDAARDFGGFGRVVEYRVLGQVDFHRAIREDLEPHPLTLGAAMTSGWHARDTPYSMVVGEISADVLAGWYEEHGERLYDRNVRRSLGLTGVNKTLVDSMVEDPEGFLYRHNGITVQCDSIEKEFFAKRAPGQPISLTLHNASVVNGAQTVTSAHRAYEKDPEAVADAYITVRITAVQGAPEGFARDITKATNTQNRMERRDYIAIDPIQSEIQKDFKLALDLEYVFRRGELDPAPESGCSVKEAAMALACAYQDPALAVRIKGSTEALWQEGPGGAYTRLFGRQPSAYQIWRSVQVLRQVRSELGNVRASLAGRAASIADSGTLLVVHMVFQRIDTESIDEPDADWEGVLSSVPGQVREVLACLIEAVDRLFKSTSYVTSTFASEERCRELVAAVLRTLATGGGAPDLALFERSKRTPRSKRPHTVRLLVDHAVIPDGAALVYKPTPVEERAIGRWLDEDPRRRRATWENDAKAPILWEADGCTYSPSGLVNTIWREAGWDEHWSSVQGPKQWLVPGEGTLVELAEALWKQLLAEDEAKEGGPAR